MNLIEELTLIAEDFDRLSDPARDDATYIYKWDPPVWYIGGEMMRAQEAQDAAVVAAAIVRQAIAALEGQ